MNENVRKWLKMKMNENWWKLLKLLKMNENERKWRPPQIVFLVFVEAATDASKYRIFCIFGGRDIGRLLKNAKRTRHSFSSSFIFIHFHSFQSVSSLFIHFHFQSFSYIFVHFHLFSFIFKCTSCGGAISLAGCDRFR